MKWKYVLAGVVVGLIGIGGWWVTRKPTKIHYHAGFQVYVDGVKQDFSADKYMKVDPCTIAPKTAADVQLDKGHLHDKVGDVVHIHTTGQYGVIYSIILILRLTKGTGGRLYQWGKSGKCAPDAN